MRKKFLVEFEFAARKLRKLWGSASGQFLKLIFSGEIVFLASKDTSVETLEWNLQLWPN